MDLWVPKSSEPWGISVKVTLSLCSSKIEAAVEAARAAFPGWSSRSPQERSQVLHRLADLLELSLEDLAQAESKDQGESRWRVWRDHSAGLFLFLLPGSLSEQGLECSCLLPNALWKGNPLLRCMIHSLLPVCQVVSCFLTVMDGTWHCFRVIPPGTIRLGGTYSFHSKGRGGKQNPPRPLKAEACSFRWLKRVTAEPKFRGQGNIYTLWWKELQRCMSKGMDLRREENVGLIM